jgi:epoxyqueuosine reductase
MPGKEFTFHELRFTSSVSRTMKAAIQQRARELGFDDCHFTAAKPPDHAAQFRSWLAEEMHGEMGYLERNAPKRIDPQQVLPGARSIVTLAASYAQDGQKQKSRASRSTLHASRFTFHGFIARYARYQDYHTVIGERLKQLAVFLNEIGGEGTRSLGYVDTGPLLERDFAERAGLGFIGKHTNLISRQFGNWLFLAEILTTLELEPDAPEKNRCGSCARCLTACPTAAIRAPFQLDARRCISYLTIELKGSIPLELRPAIGNRIYGCDDCLAVCPWNRFARAGNLMKAQARPDLGTPDLLELLALDESAFLDRFAGTPIRRIKRRGLLRNVCVALGNVGDSSALPALRKAAADPEPLITEHAGWAIAEITKRNFPKQSE